MMRRMKTRLLVAMLLIVGTTPAASPRPAAQAQGATTAEFRISPTLYFPDPASELSSRAALHDTLERVARAISEAEPANLVRELRNVDRAFVALQRHAAYLKIRNLEDTQDQAA